MPAAQKSSRKAKYYSYYSYYLEILALSPTGNRDLSPLVGQPEKPSKMLSEKFWLYLLITCKQKFTLFFRLGEPLEVSKHGTEMIKPVFKRITSNNMREGFGQRTYIRGRDITK